MDKSNSVAYVVKRYPRYSETFIVNEILAHEAAGLSMEIFALLPPSDTHFQDSIAQVRAPVQYLPPENPKGIDLWNTIQEAAFILPDLWMQLSRAQGVDVRSLHQAIRLACEIRKKGIKHIHAHFATAATSVARVASFFTGVPYSFTAHAKDIFHQDTDPEDLRRKLADAAGVITISEYNFQYLKTRFGSAADRVCCIYNGLNLDYFPFQPTQNRANEILGIGRLVEKKGFSDLLEACAILLRREIAFHCSIIGTGELHEVLAEQIVRLHLQDSVRLLGPLPQSQVIQRL
ncbi:MAG TPA: glycosyltransferase, partial [Acidobacteriota bacterium]